MFDETDHRSNDSLLEPYRPVRRIDIPVPRQSMSEDVKLRMRMLAGIALGLALFIAWAMLR